jgi:hypothetical protein
MHRENQGRRSEPLPQSRDTPKNWKCINARRDRSPISQRRVDTISAGDVVHTSVRSHRRAADVHPEISKTNCATVPDERMRPSPSCALQKLAVSTGHRQNTDRSISSFDIVQRSPIGMTGYTVHTGSTEKFVKGWDTIFRKKAGAKSKKKAAKPARKKTATKKKQK